MHVADFCRVAAELIQEHQTGVRIETVCGPADLTGIDLALRISRRYRAVPLPMWWPVVSVSLKALHKIGIEIVKPDQLTRLISNKTGTAATAITTSVSLATDEHGFDTDF
jgi:hypothetical protein